MTEPPRPPPSTSTTAAEPGSAGSGGSSEPAAPRRSAELGRLGEARAIRWAAAALAAGAFALGFVPQLGALSYEGALVVGLVVPTVVLLVSSAELSAATAPPLEHLARGAANGGLLFAAALAADLAHGLSRGFCDFWGGLENWLLGPGAGAVLAGAWSAVVAELARHAPGSRSRRRVRWAIAVALPLGGVAISVGRFYTSPMVHAYDPFVGFFSGTLYDTVVELGGLRTYRLGTAATLLALVVVAALANRGPDGRLALRRPLRLDGVALALWLLAASAAHVASGPRFGHWHTADTIAEALGARRKGERCELVYGRGRGGPELDRLAQECEAYVDEVERWLGARGPDLIRVYVFESARQKRVYMGAAQTNIAKPWRAEVYIQGLGYPHRVLGHELAHVIASKVARGPFAVAGSVGGWLPDPGLIEGLAVAASPRDEDLGPAEWARAMKDLGVLPPLRRLFALGFLAESSSTAYTASGAFVSYVHEQHGAEVVRRWYGGESLEAATGVAFDELERRWHASLESVELPPSARIVAEARFDRPGFFARRCPRAVDACRQRADVLIGRGDLGGALAELERALTLDPRDPRLRLEHVTLSARAGEGGSPDEVLGALVDDESLPRSYRDQALEARADLALASGRDALAAAGYEALLPHTIDEGRLRTLHVKLAAARDPELRVAVVALLVEEGAPESRDARAYATLGALGAQRPEDGTSAYLLARALYEAGDWAIAGAELDRALSRRLDVPRVRLEALRLAVLAACSRGDVEEARRRLGEYVAHPDARPARRASLTRLVARCSHPAPGSAAPPGGSG